MKRGERGANLVEFAIVTIFILLPLFAGIVDLGRAFYGYIVITNAAREAARYGTRLPLETANIQAKALTEITNSGAVPGVLRVETCSVETRREADLEGEGIRVTVRCDFDPITPLISDFEMSNSAILKIEGPSWS